MADKAVEVPHVNVASGNLGVRVTCSKWGCNYDEYVGQTIALPVLNKLADEHLASHSS